MDRQTGRGVRLVQSEGGRRKMVEEVIRILDSRRFPKGLHICDKKPKSCQIDNSWNCNGTNLWTSLKSKQIIPFAGYTVILLSHESCALFSETEHYLFVFLNKEKKLLTDFTEREYELLLEMHEKKCKLDMSDKNPYANLVKSLVLTNDK